MDRRAAEEKYRTPPATLVTLLERSGDVDVFSIWTHLYGDLAALQPDIASWRTPVLALTKDTRWGVEPFLSFYPARARSISQVTMSGEVDRVYPDAERSPLMQEEFDAILYLGPPRELSYSNLTESVCNDDEYIEMRTRRMTLLRRLIPAEAPPPAEMLRAECSPYAE